MNNQSKTPPLEERLERLVDLITELQEDACLAELKAMLDQGIDPKRLLSCCMEGMRRIGVRFEKGSYFISALIMAGEIMRSSTEYLSHYLTHQETSGTGGRILLGTIKGDIHDLGKNLFSLLLKCNNFEIIDLGVDVPAEVFLKEAISLKPDIIGISCVLTNSLENLKKAVTLLQKKLPTPKAAIIIGGTCLDERMANYVGSSLWAKDAAVGLKICQNVIGGKPHKPSYLR